MNIEVSSNNLSKFTNVVVEKSAKNKTSGLVGCNRRRVEVPLPVARLSPRSVKDPSPSVQMQYGGFKSKWTKKIQLAGGSSMSGKNIGYSHGVQPSSSLLGLRETGN
jgi:hypothetical protein